MLSMTIWDCLRFLLDAPGNVSVFKLVGFCQRITTKDETEIKIKLCRNKGLNLCSETNMVEVGRGGQYQLVDPVHQAPCHPFRRLHPRHHAI